MKARNKAMIYVLIMSAAVASLSVACLYLYNKTVEQSKALSKSETLYNDVRREKNRLIVEKAEAKKELVMLESINAGLLADNARLTAERDAAKTQQEEPEIVENAAEPERGDLLPLPSVSTNMISMEPFGNFAKNSEQAILQEDCFTADGFFEGVRYYLHDGAVAYCAALSTNYAAEIGTVLEVTLCNGVNFNVICADFKNPLDDPRSDYYGTPCRNYQGMDAVCILEFVVDMEKIPDRVKKAGTFTVFPELGGLYGYGGNIKSIRRLGRWWKP